MADYKTQAQQQYDASYNQKVQALKNQLAQNQQNLEQQKGGINSNYDLQVSQQNLSNKKSKNSLSNTMLGRGLSNSSIAVSGLAEQDQINNRYVGLINRDRTNALNDIEAQKALLAQNTNASLSQMEADRLDAIEALARELEDRQFEKDYKNNSLALQREQMLADQQYKNMSLAQQKELSNAQLAWQREQLQMQQALQQQQTGNSAYNTFLDAYSTLKSNGGSTNDWLNFAEQAKLYGNKNNVDLEDLYTKALLQLAPSGSDPTKWNRTYYNK